MTVSVRDMLFRLGFAYLVVGAVALAHVRKQQEETSGATPPGAVMVDIRWDDKIDADIDLWVEAPGDVPVGYSNKAGMIFNLLRDDLGHSGDPNSMNYEVAYGRGRSPGEYVVNAHLYRSIDRRFPISATVKVSSQSASGQVNTLMQSTVELTHEGQQSTVFRFRLDDQGALLPGSVNRIHKDLRTGWAHNGQTKS